MSHAYARNYIHLVFSTNQRRRCIHGEMQERLWDCIGGIAKEYAVELAAIGGTEDHVHIVATVPPKLAVAALVRALKAGSSKWMNEQGNLFSWQAGYGAFSVSASNLNSVCAFVRSQELHHRKIDSGAEFSALLKKHGIAFTPAKISD